MCVSMQHTTSTANTVEVNEQCSNRHVGAVAGDPLLLRRRCHRSTQSRARWRRRCGCGPCVLHCTERWRRSCWQKHRLVGRAQPASAAASGGATRHRSGWNTIYVSTLFRCSCCCVSGLDFRCAIGLGPYTVVLTSRWYRSTPDTCKQTTACSRTYRRSHRHRGAATKSKWREKL